MIKGGLCFYTVLLTQGDFLVLPTSQQDLGIIPLFCGFTFIMILPISIWVLGYKPLKLFLAILIKYQNY